MSLINDALKKAQKLQTQGQAPSPPNPGGTPAASGVSGPPNRPVGSSRETSMPGQIFMLLAFGAGALIALSVLATVYLLRQPAALSPVTAAPVVAQAPTVSIAPEKSVLSSAIMASPSAPAQNFAPAPVPAFDKLPTPPPTTTPAVPVTPAASPAPNLLAMSQLALSLPAVSRSNPSNRPAPSSSSGSAPSLLAVSQPALSLPAVSLSNPQNGSNPSNGPALSPSNGLDPSKPDPKILAYLDALQIAGVRVSGTSSKVLMNDRVFRQNDIVDHLLGLRLKKVESDTLTFVDERGVIYAKNL